ncbi:MAG: SLOG family protein [Clostridiaceae bacterium]|nr:SLOG family protein [Clostridiaceae bacterium]
MLQSCGITGHRPTRFKFKYKENFSLCKKIKKRLSEQFELLYQKGVRRFYVGGALGTDMWAGEILLRLKERPEYSDIELIIALPFDGHDKNWDERSKTRLAFLIRHSSETVTVGSNSANVQENYKKRNYYIVGHADVLVAVYDNDRNIRSGTGQTVRYAMQKQIPVILIHPDTAVVSSLPTGAEL